MTPGPHSPHPSVHRVEPAKSPKARPGEKRAEPTNDTSPTASSDACGKTNHDAENQPTSSRLDPTDLSTTVVTYGAGSIYAVVEQRLDGG